MRVEKRSRHSIDQTSRSSEEIRIGEYDVAFTRAACAQDLVKIVIIKRDIISRDGTYRNNGSSIEIGEASRVYFLAIGGAVHSAATFAPELSASLAG